MKQVPILDLPFEADAQLDANTAFALDSNGRATAAGADDTKAVGIVISNNGSSAPFMITGRVAGIGQLKSDGTATVAPGDKIVTASSGKGKKRSLASGSTLRRVLGLALNNVAASADLLIDVLIGPYDVFST